MALLAIALGMSIATAMIAVGAGIGDKISAELRTTGANLLVTPIEDTLDVKIGGVDLKPASEGAFIPESELPKIKGTFWGHNILGFAPFLSAPASFVHDGKTFNAELIGTYFAQPYTYGKENYSTGVRSVSPWWKVEGAWPIDYPSELGTSPPKQVLVGRKLAEQSGLKVGDVISPNPQGGQVGVSKNADEGLVVSGILDTGGSEDNAVVGSLHLVQWILGRPNAVRRVLVSALTKPEDAFGRKNPNLLTPVERDRWYCSPYANSIAFQIQEVLPNTRVEQIRQVEQNQGRILQHVEGMMLLLTLAALLASALAVSAAMAATILERRNEVGLMKSLGASNGAVAALFLAEAGLMALAGGLIGFIAGSVLAQRIGQGVFGSPIVVHPVILAVVVCAALIVTFIGSAGAVRKAMSFDPAMVLRGDA
ncbi:MAG TPA: ABC transporter permease [Candidatus Angelobacter sp.]|nr:ABC transporter permease [Candidatus Angelobacter sp.]